LFREVIEIIVGVVEARDGVDSGVGGFPVARDDEDRRRDLRECVLVESFQEMSSWQ